MTTQDKSVFSLPENEVFGYPMFIYFLHVNIIIGVISDLDTIQFTKIAYFSKLKRLHKIVLAHNSVCVFS